MTPCDTIIARKQTHDQQIMSQKLKLGQTKFAFAVMGKWCLSEKIEQFQALELFLLHFYSLFLCSCNNRTFICGKGSSSVKSF